MRQKPKAVAQCASGSAGRQGLFFCQALPYGCSIHASCMVILLAHAQDAFSCRMELIVRSKKEGKVEVKSGWYTEKKMKTHLGWDRSPT